MRFISRREEIRSRSESNCCTKLFQSGLKYCLNVEIDRRHHCGSGHQWALARDCFFACFSADFARFSSSFSIRLACLFATSKHPFLNPIAATVSTFPEASGLIIEPYADKQSLGRARPSLAISCPSAYAWNSGITASRAATNRCLAIIAVLHPSVNDGEL